MPGCSATRPPSCDLLVIGCPDRCLDLALAMQKACGSLAQQIRGKRAFPRSLARAGATRAQARRKICPTHVHPPIQSLSPLSLATKNRPTKLAYLACIGPGQPWPGSLMRARFTREVNQSDPKGKNSMQPGCKLRPLQPLSRVHLRSSGAREAPAPGHVIFGSSSATTARSAPSNEFSSQPIISMLHHICICTTHRRPVRYSLQNRWQSVVEFIHAMVQSGIRYTLHVSIINKLRACGCLRSS